MDVEHAQNMAMTTSGSLDQYDGTTTTTTMGASYGGNWSGQYQPATGCVQFWPEWPYAAPPTVWYITQPLGYCSGNAHVWGCDHAEKCKCGKATRTPPTCPHCGKSHGA